MCACIMKTTEVNKDDITLNSKNSLQYKWFVLYTVLLAIQKDGQV